MKNSRTYNNSEEIIYTLIRDLLATIGNLFFQKPKHRSIHARVAERAVLKFLSRL